jgi:hypothetical protein
MSTITQAQYQLIARGIAASKPDAAPTAVLLERAVLVRRLALHLAGDDQRFDMQWFIRACGVQP